MKLIAVFALAAVAGLLGAASALAAKTPSEIAEHWSKERMRSAIPREKARPGTPRPSAGRPKGGASWTSSAVSYAGTDNVTNGKVFFTERGINYVCSGTAVEATTGSLVWTAGHCVNEGPGAYVTNFMFAPGYNNGATPYGKWTANSTDLGTTEAWRTRGDFTYDVGIARVTAAPGTTSLATLADVARTYGKADGTTTPRDLAVRYTVSPGTTKFTSYGYPAAGKFNGQTMWMCGNSTVTRIDGTVNRDPMGIGCDMTGGSSGGGWIDSTGKVASVNSYGYSSLKNTMFGPYQGAAAEALYEGRGGVPIP